MTHPNPYCNYSSLGVGSKSSCALPRLDRWENARHSFHNDPHHETASRGEVSATKHKKLRLFFISSYPPNRARLSEYAEALLTELSAKSSIAEIRVLADRVDENSPENCQQKIKIERIWSPDNVPSLVALLVRLWKLKPDVVHVNAHFQSFGRSRFANFLGLTIAAFARFTGIKTVLTIHNLGDKVDLEKCSVNPNIITRMGIALAMKLICLSSATTVTVPSYVRFLQERYRARNVRYIPHGAWQLPKNNSHGRAIGDDPSLLMFGHMGPYKGLPILLQAFLRVSEERPDLRLVVAGASHPNFPGYLERFMKQMDPRISYIGYVPSEKLASTFEESDLVVLPYLTATGTSGVFHLACGFGRPIIASDLPEIREALEEGARALLFRPGDSKDLERTIMYALEHPEILEEMTKRNLAFAQERTWNHVASAFEKLYLEILK